MKILQKSLKMAREMFPAEYQSHRGHRTYHFAFIFKRNKLISVGVNRPYSPDGKALRFGNQFNITKLKKHSFVHAEVDAFSKCWGKVYLDGSYSLVVIRLNKNGELGESKPCSNCQQIIDAIGIKKLWWSTKKGITNRG